MGERSPQTSLFSDCYLTLDYDEVEIPNVAWREINRKQLSIHKILGSGQFGEVAKGELTEEDGTVVPCAVKTLKG